MCAFGALGLSCEAPAAPETAGVSHDNPRGPYVGRAVLGRAVLGRAVRESWEAPNMTKPKLLNQHPHVKPTP